MSLSVADIAGRRPRSTCKIVELEDPVGAPGRDPSDGSVSPKTSDGNVGSEGNLPSVEFANLRSEGKSRGETLELTNIGAGFTRHAATKALDESAEIELDTSDRTPCVDIELALLGAQSNGSQIRAEAECRNDEATRVFTDYEKTQTGIQQKIELEGDKVSHDGIIDSETLEGCFTNVSKKQVEGWKPKDSKDRKPESLLHIKSPEKKESDLGKRLCDYDLESEKNSDEDKKKKTYKDRIKTISAKIIDPCIGTIKMVGGIASPVGEASSEDSSSSPKTSIIATEETDLSDESMDTNSPSEKNETARKISSGNVTLYNVEFDMNRDEVETLEENKIRKIKSFEISSRSDESLTKGTSFSEDRSQDNLRPIESQPKRRKSVNAKIIGKEIHQISEECSEIQTSEDNLSPLEDDDDNLAVPAPIRQKISPRDIKLHTEFKQRSLSSSEEALHSSEENLLTPETASKKKSITERYKHGLTSSEESITLLSKSKSESGTDTKESWINFKSESTTASKKGLTSSEEGLTSEKGDTSKKTDDPRKSHEEISLPEMIGFEAIDIADSKQNLVPDTKTVIPTILPLSESEESGLSGDNDSSSTEIERISERLLPFRGTVSLVGARQQSDRNTTPRWIFQYHIWDKRNAIQNEPSGKISQSTVHAETPRKEEIQEDRPSSGSDTSYEETHQQMKALCEQVIKGTASTSKNIIMAKNFCIDSITFGIRRTLSDDTLYSFEADKQAQREKISSNKKVPSAKISEIPYKVCDACTFLVLLQLLAVREKVYRFTSREVFTCVVHGIGLSRENEHIYRYLLKRMPMCDFCTFPSVEKMLLQLVRSRHNVLMHKAEHLAPIYVIFPYAENYRTIGRVVCLQKKKVSDYGEKAKIRVKMADRYIFFPKLYDSSMRNIQTTPIRHDTPCKMIASKNKSRNIPAKMDDIPELNESIVEERKSTVDVDYKTLKAAHTKKRTSKRKIRKFVLKKWSVQIAGRNAQATRRNGSSSDETKSPNVSAASVSRNVARTELIALNNKGKRCVLKKWIVKQSPKSKQHVIQEHEEQSLPSNESSHLSELDADKPTKTKSKLTSATLELSDTSKFPDHKQIDGVVLVRKKRPWWKCPKKKTKVKKKAATEPAPQADFYKTLIHPTYQQPSLSYTIKSKKTGQLETRLLPRQDVTAQRMAYHYIKEMTVGRRETTPQGDEIKAIKPSLTDFQSREYEKRRIFIRDSRQSEPKTRDETSSKDQKFYDASDEKQGSESPLDLGKIDLSDIDYHFENCPIIQKGDTPYRQFLKLQQVYKTTDFEDSWVEYHVEDCSYFMIDGTTVTDLKFVNLVLAEKKDEICDCAEKLIRGGNIYHKDKSSQTFHHDLCLLFPKQLESGDIDLQGLFNPNIPSRELDDNDVIRFYFISKRSDTKDTHLIDYCEVPITKFNEVQECIKMAFSILRNKVEAISQSTQASAEHDSNLQSYDVSPGSDIASSSNQRPLKTYNLEDSADFPHVELAEHQRFLSPPRVDSESEDSTTVYSLEDCLIYATEHITNDSISPLSPDSLGISDKGIPMSGECSSEIGYVRQFTPSPRPVDQTHENKSVDHHEISVALSPGQDKDKEKQIYYHLGEFITQIQKGAPVDQRVASPRPLEIKDDITVSICQPGQPFNQNLLSPPTSLRVMSPNQADRGELHKQPTYQSLSPRLVDKSEIDKRQRLQSQEYTSAQRVISPKLTKDNSRQGLESRGDCIRSQEKITEDFDTQSLYSYDNTRDQRLVSPRRMDPHLRQDIRPGEDRIKSQENITKECTCKLDKSMMIYRHVLALEENFQQTLCSYHGTFYKEQLAKHRRTLSQGDISRRKSSDERDVSKRHHAEQLCMKGVYIPGKQRRDDQRICSQENITEDDRAKPQETIRDRSDLPGHSGGIFRRRLHSEDLAQGTAADQRKASSRRNSTEGDCPNLLLRSWREGPAPF